jgi:hypothetical protein
VSTLQGSIKAILPNGTANPVNPRIGADKGYDAHEFIALRRVSGAMCRNIALEPTLVMESISH